MHHQATRIISKARLCRSGQHDMLLIHKSLIKIDDILDIGEQVMCALDQNFSPAPAGKRREMRCHI